METRKTGTYYEFFAGSGMVRAGLGDSWQCVFANDNDGKKATAYRRNFGGEELVVDDIARVTTKDLPGEADLAWASFPCQDLSLAGNGAGLDGSRSGTFWSFHGLLKDLSEEGRAPRLVVLENVCGALTSNGGQDFQALALAIGGLGYRVGGLVIDAVRFVPQSRPRLFVIAARTDLALPKGLGQAEPHPAWTTDSLLAAQRRLAGSGQTSWIWWNVDEPHERKSRLGDLLESSPSCVEWHSPAQTQRILELMSDVNRRKVAAAKKSGRKTVGAVYRRTRPDGSGGRVQRAEVRFDDVAGCLRTPRGGSSRQTILVVEGELVRSRLLSPREAARLMGLPDSYWLPVNYNEAYHLAGDGVAVPIVAHLNRAVFTPLLRGDREAAGVAA